MAVDLWNDPARADAPSGVTVIEKTGSRGWLGREGFLVLLVCGYGAAIVGFAQFVVSTDSWFALVTGRFVAQHGLPRHDTLTVWAQGRRWVDQQWLAQLAIYELQRVGGIRLAVAVHVLLLVGAFVGAIVFARKSGANARSVALVAAVAFLPLALSSAQLRTQSFAYVLFVAILVLVTRPAAMSWMRLATILALLALWGNLHGSVVLGACLVSLRGLVDLLGALREGRGLRQRAWFVVTLPWACLLSTPYGPAMLHYYGQTILNPTLSRYLGQWQPSTLSIVSLPLFALAFGFVWLLARGASAYTLFEKLAGVVVVIFALLAVRNWVWLSPFAVALYPKGLHRIRRAVPVSHEDNLNVVLGLTGAALAAFASVTLLVRPQSWLTRHYPDRGAEAVSTLVVAHPRARVWATERWADWLLWREPRLAGRLAFDARVELLDEAQIKRLVVFSATPALLPQVRRRYEILVVGRTDEPNVYQALRSQGSVVFDDGNLLVVSSLAAPSS